MSHIKPIQTPNWVVRAIDNIRERQGKLIMDIDTILGSPRSWKNYRSGYNSFPVFARMEKILDSLGYRFMIVPKNASDTRKVVLREEDIGSDLYARMRNRMFEDYESSVLPRIERR